MKKNEIKLKKLATILRSGLFLSFGVAVAFSLAACSDDDDDEPNTPVTPEPETGAQIVVTDDSGAEVTAFEAGWKDYKTYTVVADFDYSLSSTQPNWLEVNGTIAGIANATTTVGFKATDDASVYKYAQTGELVLTSDDGTDYTYTITFAGMDSDAIEITGPADYDGWEVTTDGTTFTKDGVEYEPDYTLVCLNDDYVLVAVDDAEGVLGENGYVHFTDDKTGGVAITVDDLGDGETRSAFVYAFPAAVYETVKDNLTGEVDAEYALIHFTQNEVEDTAPFLVYCYDSQTGESTKVTVNSDYTGSHSSQRSDITDEYDDDKSGRGYVEYSYDAGGRYTYICAPQPLDEGNDWGGTAILRNHDGEATDFNNEPWAWTVTNNQSIVKGGVSYPATSVVTTEAIDQLMCLVFQDGSKAYHILVFYYN